MPVHSSHPPLAWCFLCAQPKTPPASLVLYGPRQTLAYTMFDMLPSFGVALRVLGQVRRTVACAMCPLRALRTCVATVVAGGGQLAWVPAAEHAGLWWWARHGGVVRRSEGAARLA